MEFREVVMIRRMVRDFDPEPVPPTVVRRALTAALRAPSAGFTQGWDFVVLADPRDRDRFWTAATAGDEADQPGARGRWLRGVARAPVLVVCCADPGAYVARYGRLDKAMTGLGEGAAAWPIGYWDVDAGMAALLMLLTAVDEGLGGLFFGVPAGAHDAVREALDIPPGRRLVGVVALGRPAAPATAGTRPSIGSRPGRRTYSEVVHEGRFGRSRAGS